MIKKSLKETFISFFAWKITKIIVIEYASKLAIAAPLKFSRGMNKKSNNNINTQQRILPYKLIRNNLFAEKYAAKIMLTV